MPWKKSDGTYIKEGKGWVGVDGTKFPSVWTRFSDTELKSFGLTWEDPPASAEPVDTRFYWGRNNDGSLIERKLDDEDAKDGDGKQLYEEDGKTKLINEGLKTIWIRQTKNTANGMLSPTDWFVTRKSEKGTAIPDATTTFRDSVRTKCSEIETKINACSSLADFMKLFDAPVDSDGNPTGDNPPIYDFPDEI
jgi:hypothetical protein